VLPAEAGRWDDLAAVFGRGGASNGCWCQYWLLGAEYHRRDRGLNRADLRSQVDTGQAGMIAYRDGQPVGWARLSPRDELQWLLDRFRDFPFTGTDVWAVPCLYVPSRHRNSGVMTALIDAAVGWADTHSVALQAYPVDPAVPGATRNRFTGLLSPFLRAGFDEIGRLSTDRAVVERAGTQGTQP
jgi:GNAT superfamily N-acetyltransferase